MCRVGNYYPRLFLHAVSLFCRHLNLEKNAFFRSGREKMHASTVIVYLQKIFTVLRILYVSK
jgi:hypothetical protein